MFKFGYVSPKMRDFVSFFLNKFDMARIEYSYSYVCCGWGRYGKHTTYSSFVVYTLYSYSVFSVSNIKKMCIYVNITFRFVFHSCFHCPIWFLMSGLTLFTLHLYKTLQHCPFLFVRLHVRLYAWIWPISRCSVAMSLLSH